MKLQTVIERLVAFGAGAFALGVTAVARAAEDAPTIWAPPPDVSEYGHKIDWLINITNLFCLILFLIMIGIMAVTFVKHGKNHKAEYDHGTAKKQISTALAISGVIFLIVDGNLWVNSTIDVTGTFWNFEKPQEDPNVVRIEVNARQWIWQARYAGPDGKFNTEDDALTDNDIRVPVDTPVVLQLASPDVIHSFALPHFRLRQDAVPGMINMMWFQGKETGVFPIVCIQHCGANHYQMAGELTVTTREDFDRWLDLKVSDSKAVYSEEDTEAHWGWEWKDI